MNKKQLDSLSSSLSKAINPAARKIEATAKILEHIEPLPVVSKQTYATEPLAQVQAREAQPDSGHACSSSAETGTAPVENTVVKLTTVAKTEPSPWPMATVVKTVALDNLAAHDSLTSVDSVAAVANLTDVKGELRVPNTIVDSLFPTLEPAAALVYLRLYRLSRGYKKETCIVGFQKLASATHTSQRTVQRAIDYLEVRQLIVRQGASFGGRTKGIQFQVKVPGDPVTNLTTVDKTARVVKLATSSTNDKMTMVAKIATLANLATNKHDDDDLLNTNHHQSRRGPTFPQRPITEPQEARLARREDCPLPGSSEPPAVQAESAAQTATFDHLTQTITAYTTITRNPWLQTDTVSYLQNHIHQVPIEKIKTVIQIVHDRAESRVNSFTYFVKEILATNDRRSMGGRRKALAAIVRRVRESHTGSANYGIVDLVFDVKNTCVREGVIFDNDLFNTLIKDRGQLFEKKKG
jgi:hypothetical protein